MRNNLSQLEQAANVFESEVDATLARPAIDFIHGAKWAIERMVAMSDELARCSLRSYTDSYRLEGYTAAILDYREAIQKLKE